MTTLQDRYRLDAELGRGGMGIVYRAHDIVLDRLVAVKVLSDSKLGTEGRARLLREAQAAAQLDHPNIVAVYDAGESDGAPFIVMQLVEGQSLAERRPQSLEETLDIARQICAALEHAHARGIVHRDLKPENVIVAHTPQPPLPQEEGARVKLMDFGLARSVASRITQAGALVGTVYYLAPEQALGQAVDGRADLYALGVMLYEMTAGRLPFEADDPIAVISQHLHAPVSPPRAHNGAIPPALDTLIVRLMSKRPEDRPASAREVLQMLERVESAPGAPAEDLLLLDRIVRGRLVGRSDELAVLRERWSHVQQGHGHLVLLSGEPGIGKTRLANEVIAYARLHGALVLQGGCYEYEATTPYLPLAEALRDWVSAQSAGELHDRLGLIAAELVRLAPEIEARLGPVAPNPPLPPDQERLRLFDHVARFLQTLAAGNGLLLFIDDLHWADHGTLALLHYLLRRLRNERLLILSAYREVELDRAHPLAAALVEWRRERLATRLQLGRLTLDECGALLASMFVQDSVSLEFTQAIYRETEGNPFFVEEVIKSLIEQDQIYLENGGWGRKAIAELTIPQSVKEAIGRRLNRLSAAGVEALQHAAVLGKTFEFSELAAALGTAETSPQEDRLLDALDEAIGAQLIRAGAGDAFTFTHDKIREVLVEELNPIRRRRLHQRAGESLERMVAGPASEAHVQDLAHHFLQSGDLRKALDYSLRAGERARRLYAGDEALTYFQHAAECAEALSLPDQLAHVHEAIGDIQVLRGLYGVAVDHFQRALALAETRETRAAIKTKIGTAYGQTGDARGLEFLLAAQRELDPATQQDELAHTLTMLGRYHHYRAQHAQAIDYYERARALAEPLDNPLTLTYLYAYLAGAYQHMARYEDSMRWARQCLALGERKDFLFAQAAGYEFIAEDLTLIGRWREAIDYARRDRQVGERIGSPDRLAWSEFARGWSLLGLGELAQAREAALFSLDMAEQIGESRLAIWLGGLLGFIETALDHGDAAQAAAEGALKEADALGQVILQCWCRSGLAYLHIRRQEWDRALEHCRQGVALYTPTDNRGARVMIGGVAPEAYLGAGRLEDAARAASEQLALARETGSLHAEGVALRMQGQILAAQARWDEAARAFDEAIAQLDELGSRLELGHALQQRAVLRRAIGQPELARADAEQARALFEACGAPRGAENARSFLQTLT